MAIKIQVDEWDMWMRWRAQEELKTMPLYHQEILSRSHTTYYPPIERTTLDNNVTLLKSEERSYKNYLKYIEESRAKIKKLKAKHKREAKKLNNGN